MREATISWMIENPVRWSLPASPKREGGRSDDGPIARADARIGYPSGDGKPMAEPSSTSTDMIDAIQVLRDHFAARAGRSCRRQPVALLRGGQPHGSMSPLTSSWPSMCPSSPLAITIWSGKKGKLPTSSSRSRQSQRSRKTGRKKFGIYRDILQRARVFSVRPDRGFLPPSLQGFRLLGGGVSLHRAERPADCPARCWVSTSSVTERNWPVRSRDGPAIADACRGARRSRGRAEDAEAAGRRLSEENERLRLEIEAFRRA